MDHLFESYEKIGSSPKRWGALTAAQQRMLNRARWVATEKIHGANFCILTNGVALRYAKRKALLGPDDRFFDHRRALAPHHDALIALGARLLRDHPDHPAVAVYGELFGGHYPHPEVAPVAGVQPVQTGVAYCPDVRFCAFDIALAPGPDAPRAYLSFDRAREAATAAGLDFTQAIARGSMSAMLDVPIGFDSTLPARFGLPPLDGPNKAEGLVIKPDADLWLETERGRVRPILKRKIPEFSEDKRYSQATAWDDAPADPATIGQDLYRLDLLIWEAINRVTANRLDNTVSKLGPDAMRDPRARKGLFRAFLDDVVEDVADAHGDALGALTQGERVRFDAALRDATRALFATHAPQRRDRSQR